jgi:hypothetical protein
MPNHHHLLLEGDRSTIARGMHRPQSRAGTALRSSGNRPWSSYRAHADIVVREAFRAELHGIFGGADAFRSFLTGKSERLRPGRNQVACSGFAGYNQ